MKGHCLCGSVSFTTPDVRDIGVCHCGFCRRWGGGPLLAVHCGTDVTFTGAEHVSVYASSQWAQRAFCKRCGTHLYYQLLATREYIIPAGTFDGVDFAMANQIYVDHKPPYYTFANQTPMFTEQEIIAQFAPPADGDPA